MLKKSFWVGLGLIVAVLFVGCGQSTKQRESGQWFSGIVSQAKETTRKIREETQTNKRLTEELERQVAKLLEQKDEDEKEWQAAYAKRRAEKKAKFEAAREERAIPVVEEMKELKVTKINNTVVVEPGVKTPEDEQTIAEKIKTEHFYVAVKPQFPPVSDPFNAKPMDGNIAKEIHEIAPTKNGGLALATKNGGYLIDADGKVQVVGQGKDCTAVAVSPTGEIAFAFSFKKERKITMYFAGLEPWADSDSRTVIEIHVVGGQRPHTILLGQYWRQVNESAKRLAFNADGSVLAALVYPEGLTLITEDKAWRHPVKYETNTMGFHPKARNVLVCCQYELTFDKDGACTRRYVGNDASFGPEGQIVSVQMDWENLFYEIHDGARVARADKMRFCGPDRISVSDKYIAYTMLDRVLIWDRESQEVLRTLRNVPDTEWDWLPGYVQSLVFAGPHLFVASGNGEVAKWNPSTGEKIAVVIPVTTKK